MIIAYVQWRSIKLHNYNFIVHKASHYSQYVGIMFAAQTGNHSKLFAAKGFSVTRGEFDRNMAGQIEL